MGFIPLNLFLTQQGQALNIKNYFLFVEISVKGALREGTDKHCKNCVNKYMIEKYY